MIIAICLNRFGIYVALANLLDFNINLPLTNPPFLFGGHRLHI